MLLIGSTSAQAALVAFDFTITGDNGETGSGAFSWDDAVVANGSPVANSLSDTGDVISLSITISGGNVIGGSDSFSLADCVGAFLQNAPDFVADINFWCNNGTNTLAGRVAFTNYLNDTADGGAGLVQPVLGPSSSTLTITPGSIRPLGGSTTAIPATPWWVLVLMGSLMLPLAARFRTV